MTDARVWVPSAPSASPGRCRRCQRKRDVFSIQRKGGGNYRRPNRWYSTSICEECVVELLPYIPDGVRGGTVGGLHWSIRRILAIADTLRMPDDA